MRKSPIEKWKHFWRMQRLQESYRPLFRVNDGALVSIDCETTSLKVKDAEILSIAAVRVESNRIHARDAFYTLIKPKQAPDHANVRVHGLRPLDTSEGIPLEDALQQFLQFVGGRTLLGYYLEYDVAVLNKFLKPMLGTVLPNYQVEVSGRYYDWRLAAHPGGYIDLRWETIARNLHVPLLPRHDAMNDAITAAMMYLVLRSRGYGAS